MTLFYSLPGKPIFANQRPQKRPSSSRTAAVFVLFAAAAGAEVVAAYLGLGVADSHRRFRVRLFFVVNQTPAFSEFFGKLVQHLFRVPGTQGGIKKRCVEGVQFGEFFL
jgi:hypothetical protein